MMLNKMTYECPNCYSNNEYIHAPGCNGKEWVATTEQEIIEALSDNSLDSVMRKLSK